MPSLPNPLPVLCINLESDRDKLEQTSRLFGTLPFVDFRRSPGVLTRDLPVAAMRALTRSEAVRRGTLGCFLAHVAAWEAVAAGPGWALVIEDDARPFRLDRLYATAIPPDAELVFVNRAGSPLLPVENPDRPLCSPLRSLLPTKRGFPPQRGAEPGTYGYLLAPEGARKLLDAVAQDGFYGHVDWRLLRYGTSLEDMLAEPPDSRMHNEPMLTLAPDRGFARGVLRAYCLTPALVHMRENARSSRMVLDGLLPP